MELNRAQKIGKIYILYATETGNAYQMALFTYLNFRSHIAEMLMIDEKFAFCPGNVYILFVSTTGQGDPPYSIRTFWNSFMKKSYPNLSGVKFCIYGLGDRSYGDNFNITSRKMRQRMLMLQAQQIIDIGLGDQQDYNGCFDQYFSKFLPQLKKYIQGNKSVTNPPINEENSQNNREIQQKIDRLLQDTIQLQITQQKLLSSVQGKQIYWIKLKTKMQKSKRQIKIGDILQIFPHNSQKVVKQMLNYFVDNNLNDLNLPQDKMQKYLRQCANLSNIVNFTFFNSTNQNQLQLHQMISIDTDLQIKQLFTSKLKQLSNDYNQYYNYIKKYKRNVRQVIIDFNLRIPFSCFVYRLGCILSRKYSIAFINQSQAQQSVQVQIGLLIKLEKYRISTNREVQGLCTFDLCLSDQPPRIRKAKVLKNGQFSVDNTKQLKILMISLGTGIAPFLSILFHALKHQNKSDLALFHSNRYKQQLPFNKDLLQPLVKQNKLKLFTTFTRQKNTQNKRLQFIIKQNKELVGRYVNDKIMICGSKQFCQIVCRIFQQDFGFDVKNMKKRKIICIENW